MKRGRAFLILIFIGCFVGCFFLPEANVTITGWDQDYYEYLDEWGLVTIYLKVENTGTEYISYCTVYVKVTCEDHSTYENDWTVWDIGEGRTKDESFYVDVAGKKATKVEITDYWLER